MFGATAAAGLVCTSVSSSLSVNNGETQPASSSRSGAKCEPDLQRSPELLIMCVLHTVHGMVSVCNERKKGYYFDLTHAPHSYVYVLCVAMYFTSVLMV